MPDRNAIPSRVRGWLTGRRFNLVEVFCGAIVAAIITRVIL